MPDQATTPKPLLTRKEVAAELTARGFPITPATLTTLQHRGGGPRCARWGRHTLYVATEAVAWAEGRLQPTPARAPQPADQRAVVAA